MNFGLVFKYLGIIIYFLGLAMILPMIYGFFQYLNGGPVEIIFSMFASIFVTIGTSILFIAFGRKSFGFIDKREAFLLVSLAWFLGSLLAALPFWFWALIHPFQAGEDSSFLNYINCYFEAMSGLTTTGSTVLHKITSISTVLVFWRSLTHWIGGLGIVVLFVAILPLFGGGGGAKRLFGAEASGIGNEGLSTNVRESARNLMIIYSLLTFLLALFLKIVEPDLSWYVTINHSLSTIATGGFSTWDISADGISYQGQWVLTVFMILAGINFGVYQQIYRGRFKEVVQDSELKAYLLTLSVATIFIAIWIYGKEYYTTSGIVADSQSSDVFLHSAFHVVSIQTSTGFASIDFDGWSFLPKSVLLCLMLIGGCGGSTAGGIKVIRIVAALKIMRLEIERAFRPSVVRPIRIGSLNIEYRQRTSILTYIMGVIIIMAIGSFILLLTEASGTSASTIITASIASVNNIGPGFGGVGATQNYGWVSDMGKLILSVLMAVGRLEVFAVVVLFMPRFWKTQ